jgi:hypothetical protein
MDRVNPQTRWPRIAHGRSAPAIIIRPQDAAGFASAHGGETFARFYGTKAADTNAFGRCVSLKDQAHTRASSQAGEKSTSTPGQQSALSRSSHDHHDARVDG